MPNTPREIEDRFELAALTLKRLPNPAGSGARGYGNSWPEYVRDAEHALDDVASPLGLSVQGVTG